MGRYRIPKSIPEFGDSYALVCADQSANTMVVFVHGFGGKPTSTWLDFQGLVKTCAGTYPWWESSDLFFYGYESLKTPILVNALRLKSFLKHVLSKDATGAPRFPAATGNAHHQLICVGHSEGAVVIRQMLLDRFRALKKENAKAKDDLIFEASKTDIILHSRLRLFAPACMGTNLSSLLGFAASFSSLISAIASSSLVRNELLPTSPVLQQIKTETESAYVNFPGITGFAAKVLFGDHDQVVYTASYNCDEVEYAEGRDHFSVCKPDFSYLRPLEFVS